MATNPNLPSAPPPVQPIQSVQFTQDDLKDPTLGLLNSYLNTLVNSHNAQLGANGPTVLAAGVNVAGSTVTGLAAPQSPSDAISLAHADSQYSSAAQKSQLDIGGSQTLNSLPLLWMQVNKLANPAPTTQTDVTSMRTLGTTYQNISGSTLLVSGAAQVHSGSGDSTLTCKVGPVTPTLIAFGMSTPVTIAGELVGFCFAVPPSYFYSITGTNLITTTPASWLETTL